MEEFYRNPFRRELDFNELCYASVTSLSGENPSALAAAVPEAPDALRESERLGVSSALRYQTQLSEAMRANSTLRATYEAHIEAQRRELERLSDDNNQLLKRLTRLETGMRSLVLEKDCAALAYRREAEKNATLIGKIRSLETELNSLEQRTKELATAYSGDSRQTNKSSSLAHTTMPSHYDYPQDHPQQHHQHQEFTPPHAKNESPYTPESLRYESQRKDRPHSAAHTFSGNSSTTTGIPSGVWRAEPVTDVSNMPGRRPQGTRGYGDAAPTTTQLTAASRAANIRKLEQQLQRECEAKDEMERELHKMESTRIRSGSDRAKKISLERALVVAQRAVDETRMKLRQFSALVR